MRRFATIVVATSIFAVSAANAASVRAVEGHLFVSKGNGYAPAKAGAQLVPGDRVIVSNNSKGTIYFDDGCVFELTPGKVLSIQKTSPCVDANRVTDRKSDLPGRMSQSGPPNVGDGTTALIVGGVVVGAVVVGVIAGGSSNKKKSP